MCLCIVTVALSVSATLMVTLVIAPSISQAQELGSEVCGGYVKVDEYVPGQYMRVAYWRPMGATQFLSAFLLNQAKGVFNHALPCTQHCEGIISIFPHKRRTC